MEIYLYSKSGKQYELIPQIRLTRSKNRTTGTAILEISLENLNIIDNVSDPIYGVGLKKENSLRMADICQFIWASGKPIKLLAVYIFSNLDEKQDFFKYYPYYAINKSLEFFPAQRQEKTVDNY